MKHRTRTLLGSTAARILVLGAVPWIFGLAGCGVHLVRSSCRSGEAAVINDALYFGTARPNGVVSAEQWNAFVVEEVAPRLPRGFTSWEADGKWRGASGVVDHEASHVLLVVHPDDEASEHAIVTIMRSYRQSFEQEAVLRVRSQACSSTQGS